MLSLTRKMIIKKAVMYLRILMSVGITLFSSLAFTASHSVCSPNKAITVTVNDDNGQPTYQVRFKDQLIIDNSKLGFDFQRHPAMRNNLTSSQVHTVSHHAQWQQPWGETRLITDHHNELTLSFVDKGTDATAYKLRVKVFNDGLGFRYELNKPHALNITRELTEFAFANSDKSTAWWIPARGWNRYEYTYNTTALHDAMHVHTPFTLKNAAGVHISIHEAALIDYAAMTLNQRRPGTFIADLTPWSDGIAVKTNGTFNTPWRTIQIGEHATDLLNSHLILNLNEPNKLGDVSWVKPGKYLGIWWGMHIGTHTWSSGEKHGATTKNTKEYLNFAAQYGFDGALVEGWNTGWDGDWFFNGDVFNFVESYPDFDIDAISQHSKKVGAQLIGHHETSGNVSNYRTQMKDAFTLYQQAGVSQVKTGYVADGGNIKRIDERGHARFEWHDGQFMVNEYLDNVILAAKYKLSINTHEPIKDTGLRRTYPNWLSREGARGQEFNAWGTPPNPPEHTTLLPYTRMLAGPMDFTPGIFDMSFNGLGDNTNRPQTTLAKQLALYVVLYSPIQMAADLPENYLAKPDAFQFIQDVPTDWEQSIALAGEVGDYIVFARQERQRGKYAGKDWYLGAITDEHPRVTTIKLDFLDKHTEYEAHIYQDGEKAEWKNNPYDIHISKKRVKATDSLTLKFASSGGTAIRFKAL